MRKLKCFEAISEATVQAMEDNEKVFLMGEGADDPKGIFGTTREPFLKFGKERVIDTPLSESATTGIGIGAAIEGWPNIMVHARCEFLLLAMDQILNHAAKWRYMSGGAMSVPIVVRLVVGRGWGQAAQHSQTFHSLFSYVPGLKVVLPSTAYEAKGLLYSAIKDPNPVIFVEHRWIHNRDSEVPEERYELPLNKAKVVTEGEHVTCLAYSYQVFEALEAREKLLAEGIEMEVIDMRSVRPIDWDTVIASVKKTGRVIVTDIGHAQFGATAEISAGISERAFSELKAPVQRIALPDGPTPCSPSLESIYYPKVDDLVSAAKKLVREEDQKATRAINTAEQVPFQGPF